MCITSLLFVVPSSASAARMQAFCRVGQLKIAKLCEVSGGKVPSRCAACKAVQNNEYVLLFVLEKYSGSGALSVICGVAAGK